MPAQSFESQIAACRQVILAQALPSIANLPPNFPRARLASLMQETSVLPSPNLTNSAGNVRVWFTPARTVQRARIQLSTQIFLHPENLLATGSRTGLSPLAATLAHEYAHVLGAELSGTVDHGSYWLFFDLLLGDDGQVHHSLFCPSRLAARNRPAWLRTPDQAIPANIESLF